MNISNKNYRDMQRTVNNLKRQEVLDNARTKLELSRLEKKKDGSERVIADNIGKLIGHVLFKNNN